MAFNKITDADVQNVYVQGAPDRLTGTAQQNKAIFDNLPLMIKDKINIMVDLLNSITEGNSGADNIGATPLDGRAADTIQGILEELGLEADAANRLVTLFETITEIGAVNNSPARLCTAQDIVNYISVIGGGDMLKAAYDPNNNGDKVAKSEDADALGGIPAADYMQYADLDAEPTEDSTNGVKSGGVFTAIKNTKETLERQIVNRNLLNNPCFKIDQRQGYVVPPNKNYYSDTSLSTLVGQTSEYVAVTAYASGYYTVNIGGTDYYVAVADCVRGYVGSGYGLDCWKAFYADTVILINDANGEVTFTNQPNSANDCFMQSVIPNPTIFNGKKITLTFKRKTPVSSYNMYCQIRKGNTILSYGTTTNTDTLTFTYTFGASEFTDSDDLRICFAVKNDVVTVAMLEEGGLSTTDAWLEGGNYDKSADLDKCQKILFNPFYKSIFDKYGYASYTNIALGCGTANNSVDVLINIPIGMRNIRSIVYRELYMSGGLVTSATVVCTAGNAVLISVGHSSSVEGKCYRLQGGGTRPLLLLSAEIP